MSFELSYVHLIGDSVVVYATVERYVPSWDPQDEYVYEEECVTTLSRDYYELSEDPSTEEIKTILNNTDPVWSPV